MTSKTADDPVTSMETNTDDKKRVFRLVPLESIILSLQIISAIKKNDGKVFGKPKITQKFAGFLLSRMDEIMKIKTDDCFPPISVKIKKIKDIDYYEVIDGRHRVARAHILSILSIFVEII
jgi:hypothetical protein